MKIKLHHINLATQNVSRMKHFYKNILFLDDVVDDLPTLEKSKGYSGSVGFVGDGNIQTHIAEKDLEVNLSIILSPSFFTETFLRVLIGDWAWQDEAL